MDWSLGFQCGNLLRNQIERVWTLRCGMYHEEQARFPHWAECPQVSCAGQERPGAGRKGSTNQEVLSPATSLQHPKLQRLAPWPASTGGVFTGSSSRMTSQAKKGRCGAQSKWTHTSTLNVGLRSSPEGRRLMRKWSLERKDMLNFPVKEEEKVWI